MQRAGQPLVVLAAVCLLILPGCARQADEPDEPPPPNFVLLFADDLGYGDLGSYGHPTIRTPNLDQLAREGLKLTQFYTAASLCTSSRAGLMTGRLPIRNGMSGNRGVLFPDSDGGLPPDETTLAEALRERGYATAIVGKWHLGHLPEFLPTAHGFDYYFGIPYSNDMGPENQGWDYARENFPPLPVMRGEEIIDLTPDQSRLTGMYTREAIDFIERTGERPFFLYLPYTAPHTPLAISAERAGGSKRGTYGDVVEEVDWSVGEIVATLKRLGLSENTFLIFTSDNGPWSMQRVEGGSAGLLRGAKGSPWEGGFRVPAIAWMPGTVPAGASSVALATTLDLFPTFLQMAGGDPAAHAGLDGVDVFRTFSEQEEVREEVFYYGSYGHRELVAYRNGAWKIFLRDPNPWSDREEEEGGLPWLFNVDVDPSEKYNVADGNPDVVERLAALARQHEEGVVGVPSRIEGVLPEFQESFEKSRQGDWFLPVHGDRHSTSLAGFIRDYS